MQIANKMQIMQIVCFEELKFVCFYMITFITLMSCVLAE